MGNMEKATFQAESLNQVKTAFATQRSQQVWEKKKMIELIAPTTLYNSPSKIIPGASVSTP